MLPAPLAPLDPRKTRALTTIYAPRKLRARKHKTAQTRMLDNDIPIKPTLSPFHPLPAIGQKSDKPKTKVIVFDLNNSEGLDNNSIKLHDVLKPLTPLRIHGYARKSSLDLDRKPQQLLRENTYDVIEPIYLNAAKVRKRDTSITRTSLTPMAADSENTEKEAPKESEQKLSPKTRFKKAAIQVAKLSSLPETGKLLCLRERQTFNICKKDGKSSCKLEELPKSPTQKLNKLTEIFQGLEMNGRQRDKLKKENSWF
ncbi:uncharacterized protein LOC128683496 [Plodia interpunctella]|uniref:uncharacterized protein LOC128683496 n=1 Tax=Plodia interpunctella TaxID=58824 RepID=UPI002367F8CB|nr:uncharacterized protein LOC128683496 [Plodia interpunctella]